MAPLSRPGKEFQAGTTGLHCYVHPEVGTGISVIAFSALLGIVVWLSGASPTAIRQETTTSIRWNSLTSVYPVVAIARRSAPTRFMVPSATLDGPNRIS
jgi:hypothetical protein